MVDYSSNFIEDDHLTETTSQKMIECCKCQFARYGILDVFIFDNGPQFSSSILRKIPVQTAHTEPPYTHNPMGRQKKQSRLLKSSPYQNKKIFQLALLDFRNAPTLMTQLVPLPNI